MILWKRNLSLNLAVVTFTILNTYLKLFLYFEESSESAQIKFKPKPLDLGSVKRGTNLISSVCM